MYDTIRSISRYIETTLVMKLSKNKKVLIPLALAAIAAGTALVLMAVFPRDTQEPRLPPADSHTEGFTFFNVGAGTVFTESMRKALNERLGSGVVETRGTIDLKAGGPDFLKTHNPEIHRFHAQLNDSAGARVEHHITRLTYRYALKKNTPFFYVELVFSNHSDHPLYFRIRAKKEGADIIDEIRKKYGKPEEIPRSEAEEPVLRWRQGDDVFLIFQNRDRFGDPEFLLMTYFKKNIQELINIEEKERMQAEEARKQSIQKAF